MKNSALALSWPTTSMVNPNLGRMLYGGDAPNVKRSTSRRKGACQRNGCSSSPSIPSCRRNLQLLWRKTRRSMCMPHWLRRRRRNVDAQVQEAVNAWCTMVSMMPEFHSSPGLRELSARFWRRVPAPDILHSRSCHRNGLSNCAGDFGAGHGFLLSTVHG